MYNGRYVDMLYLSNFHVKLHLGPTYSKKIILSLISAGEILQKLDETADPCQDMVQFACGGWFENNEIPPSENRWGVFNELESKISSVLHGNYLKVIFSFRCSSK